MIIQGSDKIYQNAEIIEEVNKINQGDVNEEKFLTPLADVYSNDKQLYIEIELVGVDKNSLDINLENNLLTIYSKKSEKLFDGYKLQYAEFYQVSFKRQFRIDGNINSNEIKAKIESGVLKLHIPFKKIKAKKIPLLA